MRITASGRAGFTLVELMIVVAIIGLLATIATPNLVRARARTQANACINNLRRIDDATQQWALENRQAVGAAVGFTDIRPYLKSDVTCPAGGADVTFATSYTLSTVSNQPVCQISPDTHFLADTTAGSGGGGATSHPVQPLE